MSDAATMVLIVERARELRSQFAPYKAEKKAAARAWVKLALALCHSKGWSEAEAAIEHIWWKEIQPRQRRYSEVTPCLGK